MREVLLDNGVRVITEKRPDVRSATVGVWVGQGSAHETAESGGASHLMEHLVFKGTERRSAHEIALSLESLGGVLDAYTTREHTSFQAQVLDEHLPVALDVLADLVLHPRLDPADLELDGRLIRPTVVETLEEAVADLAVPADSVGGLGHAVGYLDVRSLHHELRRSHLKRKERKRKS